jgi:hypothetical protein
MPVRAAQQKQPQQFRNPRHLRDLAHTLVCIYIHIYISTHPPLRQPTLRRRITPLVPLNLVPLNLVPHNLAPPQPLLRTTLVPTDALAMACAQTPIRPCATASRLSIWALRALSPMEFRLEWNDFCNQIDKLHFIYELICSIFLFSNLPFAHFTFECKFFVLRRCNYLPCMDSL